MLLVHMPAEGAHGSGLRIGGLPQRRGGRGPGGRRRRQPGGRVGGRHGLSVVVLDKCACAVRPRCIRRQPPPDVCRARVSCVRVRPVPCQASCDGRLRPWPGCLPNCHRSISPQPPPHNDDHVAQCTCVIDNASRVASIAILRSLCPYGERLSTADGREHATRECASSSLGPPNRGRSSHLMLNRPTSRQ